MNNLNEMQIRDLPDKKIPNNDHKDAQARRIMYKQSENISKR